MRRNGEEGDGGEVVMLFALLTMFRFRDDARVVTGTTVRLRCI